MTLATLLLAAALLAPAPAAADTSAADLQRMQGDWMVATMKVNGFAQPEESAQALFRTVEGAKYSVFHYSKVIATGTFKLDATQTPHTIDSTPEGKGEDQKLLGIYEFDGDTLRICNAPPGKPRPKDFGAKLGSQHTLVEWIPEKP